jgi:hypothetical protein
MSEIYVNAFVFEANSKATGEKVQFIKHGKSRLTAYNKLLKQYRLTHEIKWA